MLATLLLRHRPDASVRLDATPAAAVALVAAAIAGPADGIALALVLATIGMALARRHSAMLLCYAASLMAGSAPVLIAPAIAALLFNRRFSWRPRALVPLAMMAGGALLWRLSQVVPFDPFLPVARGAPSFWAIATCITGMPLLGPALAATVGGAALVTAHFSARMLDDRTLLTSFLIAAAALAVALPGTSTGVFLLPVAIALVRAATLSDGETLLSAALLAAGWLLGLVDLPAIGAVATIAATILAALPLLRSAANDNGDVADYGTQSLRSSLR